MQNRQSDDEDPQIEDDDGVQQIPNKNKVSREPEKEPLEELKVAMGEDGQINQIISQNNKFKSK